METFYDAINNKGYNIMTANIICSICSNKAVRESIDEPCSNCGADKKSLIPADNESVKSFDFDFFDLPENLEDVRTRARLKLKGYCAVYPYCDGNPDRICQREPYGKPIGLGGAGSGASFTANIESIQKFNSSKEFCVEVGSNAREVIEDHHDLSKITQKLVHLYHQVLEN